MLSEKKKITEVQQMSQTHTAHITLDEWIAREVIPCSLDAPATFNAAVDKVITSLGDAVELLGFGETLHGGEELLILRNQLFQHLVEAHGYSAIAIESSFPMSHVVNEYIAGRGLESYEDVQKAGISHDFGLLHANRELVEWMRSYNASHAVKLHFYGFDSPTEITGADSPGHVLHFALDYLTAIDKASGQQYRDRIDTLIGQDAAWENPEAMRDATKGIGLSPQANALRIATEELIAELSVRRPELEAASDRGRYLEALQFAVEARLLLNYHANLARESEDRMNRLIALRDAIMAENLAYIVSRERDRGKVLVFAHNTHLKRSKAELHGEWQGDSYTWVWWPVGAHLNAMFGSRYATIGSAVGESPANGIGQPEAGTLEQRLTAAPGPMRFIPTHQGQGLPLSDLPIRSRSVKNLSYSGLTARSFTDFDWLAILDTATFNRGWSPQERLRAGSDE
jgi:erythromycin esterase-like protein